MLNRNARALLFVACAFLYPLRAAAIDSSSPNYQNTRSSIDSGGVRKTSTRYRLDAAAGEISAPAGASTNYSTRDGLKGIQYYPARVTGVWSSSGASAGTVYLQWVAPGNDGVEVSTAGASVVRYSSIAAQSPALSDAMFNAATSVTPAPPAPLIEGTTMTLTVTGLTPGVTYYFAVKASERDGLRSVLSLGATAQAALGPGPTSVAFVSVGSSSETVSFGAVGASGYVVQASTAPDFSGTQYSSDTTTGATVLAPQGLNPNTTYYLRAGSLWGATTVYAATVLSTSTLSQLVSGATVYQINVTSMVVNWIPLLNDVSSDSASGYILQVSSLTNFSTLWTTSSTANVALSTLTVTGLTGGVTYYFEVGTVNWDGAVNYASSVSTLMPVQLGVAMTTHTVALGNTAMDTTMVISTSIIVTNTGNVSETYSLSATTTGAVSPWVIGSTQSVNQYVLWAVVNSTQPGTSDFGPQGTSPDLLSNALQPCTTVGNGGKFTMDNQTCVQVPVGGTNTLWIQVATPLATSTVAPQNIQLTATAVKDP